MVVFQRTHVEDQDGVPRAVHMFATITEDGSIGTNDARVLAAHIVIIESVEERSEGAVDEPVSTGHVVSAGDDVPLIAGDSITVDFTEFA